MEIAGVSFCVDQGCDTFFQQDGGNFGGWVAFQLSCKKKHWVENPVSFISNMAVIHLSKRGDVFDPTSELAP